MAIRYSGDVEVRMHVIAEGVRIRVRAPGVRRSAIIKTSRKKFSSKDYDSFALIALSSPLGRGLPFSKGRGGQPVIRRVFVSPCPTRF